MPKASARSNKSSKSYSHAPAAKFNGASKALAGGMSSDAGALAGPDGMDFTSFVGQSVPEALRKLAGGPSNASTSLDGTSSSGDPYAPHITKKDKRALKREALLSRLNPDAASALPYSLSSSSTRRAKRKAKTELTGGSLSALTLALTAAPMTPAVIPGAGVGEENENWDEEYEGTSRKARKAANRKANATAAADEGKIGEGKGKPMSAKARSKAVRAEALRTPQILAHPAFRANPWATIRQHAGNSLVMKQPEPPKEKKTSAGAPSAGAGNRGWGGLAGDDEMEMDM